MLVYKKCFFVILIFLFIFAGGGLSMAQSTPPPATSSDPFSICDIDQDEDTVKDFENTTFCQQRKSSDKIEGADDGIFTQIIKVIIYLTAGLSTIFIIIGAFKYVTSQGEASQIKSAKDTITYALIGLFVAISAFVVISFVVSKI